MKRFLKNIIILTLIVGMVVSIINYAYSIHIINLGTMGNQKNDRTYIKDVPQNIQICNFGNSHGYYGFNYEDYTDNYTCFNFALPSQTLSYDYLILKNFKENIAPGAVVFICISYLSFYGNPEINLPDFSAKNQRYYHFLEKENIKNYEILTDISVNWLPVLTSPSIIDLVETTVSNKNDSDLWNITTNKELAKKHGPERYKEHVAKNVTENGQRIVNTEEINAAYNIINLCQQIGAVPVLLTTPYLSEYTSAVKNNDTDFYNDFYGIVNQIAKDTGVDYYDYQFDSRFKTNYDLFINTDHLNRSGAKVFTDILMKDCIFEVNS